MELSNELWQVSLNWYKSTPGIIKSETRNAHSSILNVIIEHFDLAGKSDIVIRLWVPNCREPQSGGCISQDWKILLPPPNPDLIFSDAQNRYVLRSKSKAIAESSSIWVEISARGGNYVVYRARLELTKTDACAMTQIARQFSFPVSVHTTWNGQGLRRL